MEAQADPLENAFVLRAAPSSDFETGKLEGRVLHVESGRELEFRSVKEMVMFVSECVTHSRGKGPGRLGLVTCRNNSETQSIKRPLGPDLVPALVRTAFAVRCVEEAIP